MENWKLEEVRITFMTYGENKGKYQGKIKFENNDEESFIFKIRHDMAEDYIKIMSSDIVKSAESLSSRLIESLGLNNK